MLGGLGVAGLGLGLRRPGVANPLAAGPFMFASNRMGYSGQRTAATASTQYQVDFTTFDSAPYDQICPKFLFQGFYCDNQTTFEHSLGNDVLHQGVVLEIAGTRYPLTVGGSASFTVTDGSWVWTDDNSIVIPANTKFRVGVATYVPTGAYRLTPFRTNATDGDGFKAGSADVSSYLTSGTLSATPNTWQSGPVLMLAKGWQAAGQPPVPLLIGDSILKGGNDDNYWNENPRITGDIARAINDNSSSTRYAYANLGVPGVAYFGQSLFAKRFQILSDAGWPFTSIVSEMGINNSNATTAISGWPAWGAFLKTMGNKPIIQTTMLPKVTLGAANLETTTLANQTVNSFESFNNWVRAKSDPNMDGFIDRGGIVESAAGSGLWAVPGFSTTLAAAYTAGQLQVTLTASPPIGCSLVLDPGLSTYKHLGIVTAVSGTGPYVATIAKNASSSFASGVTATACLSNDGLHPTTTATLMLVPATIAAKNAGVIV